MCCGHVFPIKTKEIVQVDGHLVEMRRAAALERRERREERKKIGRARTLPQLLAIAEEKGYKPGWAYKIFYGRRY